MTKTDKKKIEKEIIDSINKLLSGHHKVAAGKLNKSIKAAGKSLSKKFNKAIKSSIKKVTKKKSATQNTAGKRKSGK